MYAQGRKKIKQAEGNISTAKGLIEEVLDGERAAYNKLSGTTRKSERGERMAEFIEILEIVVEDLASSESFLKGDRA
jgi:hypothetical protein